MHLNEKLKLVLPLYGDNGDVYSYVHSEPFSVEAFEMNHKLMALTFTEIVGSVGVGTGPRVAFMTMKSIAKEMDGGEALLASYTNELHRLTNVIMQGPHGWEVVPFDTARHMNTGIASEDAQEVENAITFFTVACAMYPKRVRARLVGGVVKVWDALTESRNCSEFANSLPTLKKAAPTAPNLGAVFAQPL